MSSGPGLDVGLTVYLRNRPAVIGLVIVVVLGGLALAAPWLSPYEPLRGVGPPTSPPQASHIFGTDPLGRDIATQVVHGLRVSFYVGVASTVIALIIGILVGAISGFAGGMIDDVLMRVTEAFQVVPRFFLAILLVATLGQRLSVITFSIAILSWPPLARVVRAEFLSKKQSDYVRAARVIGASRSYLIVREILPNAMAPVVVTASLGIGSAILIESGLAFIGLSDPSLVSLGRNLQSAIRYMRVAWWLSIFPGVALSMLILGFNLVGDGISDMLNPHLR